MFGQGAVGGGGEIPVGPILVAQEDFGRDPSRKVHQGLFCPWRLASLPMHSHYRLSHILKNLLYQQPIPAGSPSFVLVATRVCEPERDLEIV